MQQIDETELEQGSSPCQDRAFVLGTLSASNYQVEQGSGPQKSLANVSLEGGVLCFVVYCGAEICDGVLLERSRFSQVRGEKHSSHGGQVTD